MGFNPRAGNVPGATRADALRSERVQVSIRAPGTFPARLMTDLAVAIVELFQSARRERSRRDP